MIQVKLDEELLAGLEGFIADRDTPPVGHMSYADAVNVIVKDWLMGQGYIPLPDDPGQTITRALKAAQVPD